MQYFSLGRIDDMLNLLMISNKYADLVASHWHIAFSISSWVAIACIILLIVTLYLTRNRMDGEWKNWLPISCVLFVFILTICSWLFWFNSLNADVNSALIRSPRTMRNDVGMSYEEKKYLFYILSPYDIPHTVHIIRHNQKALPQEWEYDEFLLHHTGKEPSRDHIKQFKAYTMKKNYQSNYQNKLIHKEHFDKYNRLYCTKQYVKNPAWNDYL